MNYYIVENNQQAGPFTIEQLRSKGITREVYVWAEGMAGWEPAGNVSELQVLFQQVPPVQPQYQAPPQQPYAQPQQQYQPQPQYQAQPQYQPQPQQQSYSQSAQKEPMGPMPDDYKKRNIILMVMSLLCCNCLGTVWLILGILGLMEGNKVQSMYAIGNYNLAQRASEKAHKWAKIGTIGFVITEILSVIAWILYIVLVVAAQSSTHAHYY